MNRAERYKLADWLRYALVQMTIRYGSSTQKCAYAEKRGKDELAARHRQAARRQFAAIQRLATSLHTLARGESDG